MSKTIEELLPELAEIFVDHYKATGFNNGYQIEFEHGSKYIRIVCINGNQRHCAGFVCAKDSTTKTGSFKAGDLLKCATWKAPALNFARGNIFDLEKAKNDGHIPWTGIA